MASQWIKGKSPGIRYREHSTRLHNGKPDRYFTIYYKVNGKLHEEALGWASEGWNESKAAIQRNSLKQAHATGEGPQTLQEKREMAEEKREQAKTQKLLEQKEALTFGHFFEETYLPHTKTSKSKRSIDRENQLFRLWISPVIKDTPFKKISALHMEKIRKDMQEGGSSPRSINYAFALVRQVFNYAKYCQLSVVESPTQQLKMLKFDNNRIKFLTKEEATNLLRALKKKSEQIYQISLTSLECGLRANEIFSLKWKDIDLNNEQIIIWDTKNTKTRIVPMTDNIKHMFLQIGPKNKNDLVFPGRNSCKINQISKTFEIVVNNLGFNAGVENGREKVVFHTLRHTYASWLVQEGVSLYTVKELMGHSSLAMTSRYAHLGNGELKRAVKKIDEKINLDNIKE